MEPSQRSSCLTLSMVTSWTTSRKLYRCTKVPRAFLINAPFQMWVSEFCFSFIIIQVNWSAQRKIYSALNAEGTPCLKFLPGSSFTRLLRYLWKCSTLTCGIQCWHDFYINHIYCFVTPHTPKRNKGCVKEMIACVNKWSPLPTRAYVIIHTLLSFSAFTQICTKRPQKMP